MQNNIKNLNEIITEQKSKLGKGIFEDG